MARLPRYVLAHQPQHVIQRGNNRQAIFSADADYRFFLEKLHAAAEKHGCAIHAYVLMTNHVEKWGRVHISGAQSAGRSVCLEGLPLLGGRTAHRNAVSIWSLKRSLPSGQPRFTAPRISLSAFSSR